MQSFGAPLRQGPYSFKHCEVIGAKFLQSLIRSAKFIDRMPPQPKKYSGGNGVFLTLDENNKSKAWVK
jgi:hypothetical protein